MLSNVNGSNPFSISRASDAVDFFAAGDSSEFVAFLFLLLVLVDMAARREARYNKRLSFRAFGCGERCCSFCGAIRPIRLLVWLVLAKSESDAHTVRNVPKESPVNVTSSTQP